MAKAKHLTWPDPIEAVEEFYEGQMKVPLTLFRDLQPKSGGSRRPTGQRRTLWTATIILSAAALEAGLKQIVFGAHGVRSPHIHPTSADRTRLVDQTLTTPNPFKIRTLLLAHFGFELAALPSTAQFELHKKGWALGGSGQGSRIPGPSTWKELSQLLEAINHIRNGAAHADKSKLDLPPKSAEGVLWVPLKSDGWSIQQPHALNALRVVIAVFNTVADSLDQNIGIFNGQPALKQPDDLVRYESS